MVKPDLKEWEQLTVPAQPSKSAVDSLLRSIKPPQLNSEAIANRVLEAYGLSGAWRQLGGEREQNFRLVSADGRTLVVKVASVDEPLDSLLFQTEALEHIRRTDPDLPVPRLVRTLNGQAVTDIMGGDGAIHALRILTFVPGNTLLDAVQGQKRSLSAADLLALGATCGRLARALQGFRSDGAPKAMPWDISNRLIFADQVRAHLPAPVAAVAGDQLPRLESVISDILPTLRSQVIYNDFHESNVLAGFGDALTVEGIIDFGDMIHGPVVQDLSVCIASLMHWSDDPLFAASCLVRGYQRFMPLTTEDLSVLKDLVLARMLLQVGLVSYQTKANNRQAPELEQLQSLYIGAIINLSKITSTDFVSRMMPGVVPMPATTATSPVVASPSLLQRRQAVLGSAYTFYNEPLELIRGRGCLLYDSAGNEYLDCYNNVANVGHCHPYVVDTLARQASTLNTNSRYLHEEVVRLGERLSATLPHHLDTWFFVCTGSEANDLAVRLARAATGKQGIVVTENSYHGNTTNVAPLSLIDYDLQDRPAWVETVPPPNLYRGLYRAGTNDAGERYAQHVSEAARRLDNSGHGLAGLMIDSIFDANGALVPPADYLPLAYAAARREGALTIADEVQMGFGRSGTHMWGFQAFGVEPDIVTMGKPMGNGHPIAALVTRRDLAELVQKTTGYFNTFGGNTVSAAVANACLDVLQGERLQDRAAATGAHLLAGLHDLMKRYDIIGHIHGRGLFLGVELVLDRETREPAKFAARWVRERLKSLGVLVASTGPLGNIIKIRPPLAFGAQQADQFLDALHKVLLNLPSQADFAVIKDTSAFSAFHS
ncbi:aminotransferase class III-fold pyridoxal phosphate-dependent enzyme [Aestuariivirga sp.]|uniref:aminotransferase class III-fold pyridoxal phosphate-dependent enzyme n=1 Tax=Aestuariivirga sp. TaxID=2650926 RepID=UPI0039E6ABE5